LERYGNNARAPSEGKNLDQNLETPTLGFGALIRISGDGIEEAKIRWRRDVILALKVFRDCISPDQGCDGRRRHIIHDLDIADDLAQKKNAGILSHGIVMALEIALDGA